MRRLLEAGKFRTILSIFLFMIVCGVFVVHATSGSGGNGKFYTEYNTGAMGNILTAEGWDYMMNDLDRIIPEGTVMAFLTDECPEGWNEFTGAEGRFLMGASSGFGGTGGKNFITEMPSHNHKLKYKIADDVTDNSKQSHMGMIVDYDTNELPGSVPAPNYFLDGVYEISTSTAGESTSADITNKYVRVRYCIK